MTLLIGRRVSGSGTRPGHLSRFIIALTLTIALLMTGCSEPESATTIDPQGNPNSIGTVRVHYVDLPDGRQVLCVYEVINANWGGGGVSCDWQGARPNLKTTQQQPATQNGAMK